MEMEYQWNVKSFIEIRKLQQKRLQLNGKQTQIICNLFVIHTFTYIFNYFIWKKFQKIIEKKTCRKSSAINALN